MPGTTAGLAKGKDTGQNAGYRQGKHDGMVAGIKKGRTAGIKKGRTAGYASGYAAGVAAAQAAAPPPAKKHTKGNWPPIRVVAEPRLTDCMECVKTRCRPGKTRVASAGDRGSVV